MSINDDALACREAFRNDGFTFRHAVNFDRADLRREIRPDNKDEGAALSALDAFGRNCESIRSFGEAQSDIGELPWPKAGVIIGSPWYTPTPGRPFG